MVSHQFLHALSQRFALDSARTQSLWQLAGLHQPPDQLAHWLRRVLGALAALLLGAAVVFWVAANWQSQSRSAKLLLLQAAVALPVVAALLLPRWRSACLLLATLALGGLLAYVGQTYQTGADPWQLFALWAALTLPWTLVARRDALWALWLLIAGTALGLWSVLLERQWDWWSWGKAYLPLGHVLRSALPWLALLLLPWVLPRLRLVNAHLRISTPLGAAMALGAWVTYGYMGLLSNNPGWQYWANLALVVAALLWLHTRRPRDLLSLALALLALNALGLGLLARFVLETQLVTGAIFLMLLVTAGSVGASGHWLWRVQRQQQAQAQQVQ